MAASDVLKNEHRNIERLIKILKTAVQKLEADEAIDPQVFIKSGSFITQYMDQKHHAKEEKIFFTLLEQYGFSRNTNPLKDLLKEHDQAREYTRALRQAAYRLEDGDKSAKSELIERAHQYIRLLTHHIKNEDENLFPLADSKFTDETSADLTERFTEYDENFPAEPLLKKLNELESSL